jgi:hypothetical protein
LRSFALILRAIFNAQRLGLLRTLLLALGQVQGDQLLVKGVGRPKSERKQAKGKKWSSQKDGVKNMESKTEIVASLLQCYVFGPIFLTHFFLN